MRNRSRRFQTSCAMETGLSNIHKMTEFLPRSHLPKSGSQIKKYRGVIFTQLEISFANKKGVQKFP